MTAMATVVAMPARSCRRLELAVDALTTAERLVLWALRTRIDSNGDPGYRLASGFVLAFGLCRVEAAVQGFEEIVSALQAHARRPLRIMPERCCRVAFDEQSALSLTAACQHRMPAHAQAVARWLVRPEGQVALLNALQLFTTLLSHADLVLPLRAVEAGAGDARARPTNLKGDETAHA